MNFILYVIPLIVIVAYLLFGQADKLNKKSILQSLGVLVVAIILSQILYYFSNFFTNVVNHSGLLIVIAILIDVILQSTIIFVETILYRKIFGLTGKIHIWTYIIWMVCVILSAILYYIDYGNVFVALANGLENISYLDMFTMYTPKFVNFRRILAIVPAIVVILSTNRKGL